MFCRLPDHKDLENRKLNRKQGSILIVALWSLCLLTTFIVYSGLIVRQKISLIDRIDSRETLHFISEAGVNTAIVELKKKDQETDDYYALNEDWSNNPRVFDKAIVGIGKFTIGYNYDEGGKKKMRYGLLDEAGKIDINKAKAEVISRLLEKVAGLNEQAALDLAYCIDDWRDSNSFFQHPQYGAEDRDYKNMSSPYEAKDAEFEILEELLLVKGMSKEIFDKIKDFVTIYGGGLVNINTAPRQVLVALGINTKIIDKILAFRKGEDEIAGTFDDNIFSIPLDVITMMSKAELLSSSEVAELNNYVSGDVFVTGSGDFTVKCTSTLATKEHVSQAVAVVNSKGLIKYWREEY